MKHMVKFGLVLVSFLIILPLFSTRKCDGIQGDSCCFGYQMHTDGGRCIPCEIGYTGMNCVKKCPFPTYGPECQMICTCEEKYCDFVNGCIRILDGIINISSAKINHYESVGITTERFNGGFISTLDKGDNDKNYKKDNATSRKNINKSDGLMHAIIGLAIVALLISLIYMYTHHLEKHRIRSAFTM